MKLENIFKKLKKDKRKFLGATKGSEFEDKIEFELKKEGFSKITKDDFNKKDFLELKNRIQEKLSDEAINNFLLTREYINSFLAQPFGSQDYPDFIVITDKKIIPIEIKFSKGGGEKPMWNSNFPKGNGIYIFGSYEKQDLTFWIGKDVLTMQERKKMVKFFRDLEEPTNKINKELIKLDKLKTGFQVYVRRAYEQKKTLKDTEMSFLKNKNREWREENVIKFLEEV